MAIEVSAQYGGVISEALVLSAKKGMETMRKLGQRMGSVKYPATLPRGTGNYDSFGISDNFYPESEADILAETTGAIGLEENT
jgi:hypothetical protein